MVRLAGIEPTTPWFVAKYSIQLSYIREALNYTHGFCNFEAIAEIFFKKTNFPITDKRYQLSLR